MTMSMKKFRCFQNKVAAKKVTNENLHGLTEDDLSSMGFSVPKVGDAGTVYTVPVWVRLGLMDVVELYGTDGNSRFVRDMTAFDWDYYGVIVPTGVKRTATAKQELRG